MPVTITAACQSVAVGDLCAKVWITVTDVRASRSANDVPVKSRELEHGCPGLGSTSLLASPCVEFAMVWRRADLGCGSCTEITAAHCIWYTYDSVLDSFGIETGHVSVERG
jgi:hypothetical protein